MAVTQVSRRSTKVEKINLAEKFQSVYICLKLMNFYEDEICCF